MWSLLISKHTTFAKLFARVHIPPDCMHMFELLVETPAHHCFGCFFVCKLSAMQFKTQMLSFDTSETTVGGCAKTPIYGKLGVWVASKDADTVRPLHSKLQIGCCVALVVVRLFLAITFSKQGRISSCCNTRHSVVRP